MGKSETSDEKNNNAPVKRAVVFTLGCKVNSCESASLMTGLKKRGYEVSDRLEPADLYVINTCAVTAEAEKKSRQAIARARKFGKDAEIYVCGCASQKDPQSFIERGAKAVTGAKSKDKLLDHLGDSGIFIDGSDEYFERYMPCRTSRTREYIKIQDGCNNFCAYCIIPYLRGRSRSRSPESIIAEIRELGPKEAVITGINVSAYEYEGKKLPDLVNMMADADIGCRIRFGSLEAVSVTRELLEATARLKNFAQHFHLSLQSGSDAVLKAMNRRYTAAGFSEKVRLLRSFYPDAAVTTDVIAGFSAETEENFEETLDFCDLMEFSDIHCFPYSVREGTAGALLKKLPDDVKRERLNRLMEKKKELKDRYIKGQIGKTLDFIPEKTGNGFTDGYTGNYVRVYVKGSCPEDECRVKLTAKFKDGALGVIV